MARLTEYNFELCKEICIKVSQGANIKAVLDSSTVYPSFPTWCAWKREHAELLNLYTCSIQDKAEAIPSELDDVMDDLKNGLIDPPSARVIIDTKKWLAGKYYPKMFGDKLDLTGTILNSAPLSIDEIRQAKTNLENEL